MFYIMYLSGLCSRRHWSDPLYEVFRARQGGFMCTVRVNNREYSTDTPFETEQLAKDAAATRAYMICRNFSVNDGMYPGQRQSGGGQGTVIQGLPVAIGKGRRPTYSSTNDYDSGSTGSGGSSPRSSEYDLAAQSRRSSNTSVETTCYCGRRRGGRCSCARESAWR